MDDIAIKALDEIVFTARVKGYVHQGPNATHVPRKSIVQGIRSRLKGLGTDRVDHYRIHVGLAVVKGPLSRLRPEAHPPSQPAVSSVRLDHS